MNVCLNRKQASEVSYEGLRVFAPHENPFAFLVSEGVDIKNAALTFVVEDESGNPVHSELVDQTKLRHVLVSAPGKGLKGLLVYIVEAIDEILFLTSDEPCHGPDPDGKGFVLSYSFFNDHTMRKGMLRILYQ